MEREERKKPINPIDIFNESDRDADKEYLRPAQKSILEKWYNNHCDEKDVIIKLQTGQGKTLIGLLALQSCLNSGSGPVAYICPNNYLVQQTVQQANSIGLKTVQFEQTTSTFPREFLNSEAILVTNCNKLFNGKSVFGVVGSGKENIQLDSIVIDDAHKCLDIIRESFSIRINRKNENRKTNEVYQSFIDLFGKTLKRQGEGTYMEMIHHGIDSYMVVPFWSWIDKKTQVLDILQNNLDKNEIFFVWDLLKDKIEQCTCLISGKRMEIVPRLIPLDLIPSYFRAKRRIFLSATLTEDSFLVKDFRINPKSVLNPIVSEDVKYSGERLIIMPTLVDSNLRRDLLIKWVVDLAKKNGNFGVVSIVPSYNRASDWGRHGSLVTPVKNIHESINELQKDIGKNDAKRVLTLVNTYDGIDLPGNICRILCIDSLPSYRMLIDRYNLETRYESSFIKRKIAQRIEQGIGRGIRGISDWCIVIIIGNNITDFLSENIKRKYLSEEAQLQIGIGEELSAQLKEEMSGLEGISKLINQCINRNDNWKSYYLHKMTQIDKKAPNKDFVNRAVMEKEAELYFQQCLIDKAVKVIDDLNKLSSDEGWLMQLKATYLYSSNKTKSMDCQIKAHTLNQRLLRPEKGMKYSKISSSKNRASRILEVINNFESYNSLNVHLHHVLDSLKFGIDSELFETNINEFGKLLGFVTDRPEKRIGCGPDNLWQLDSSTYWIIECKNMVKSGREKISKTDRKSVV